MARTILLVDDSPTILKLLRHVLLQAGYLVTTANDGLEAIDILKDTQVDLVITDVNMPRLDGLSLISRLRRSESTRDLPMVVLSSQQGQRDQSLGKGAGADLYLGKPVTPDVLLKNIDELLKKHYGGK